ncbi:MAG: WD40 repeat domain-containing protein [Pseudomonadota bacterium]
MLDPRPATIAAESFTRHRGPVTSVAAVPGRAAVVAAAYDGAVSLFDLDTGRVELLGYHRHLANHVTVNVAGTYAASSSSDYDIHIWDLHERLRVRVLRGHSDDVECFTFVDAETGLSASRDRRIIVWDLATGAIRRVIEGHEKDVLSVTHHDGLIYSSGDDMTLRQWDLASGALLRTWGPFETETDTCAVDVLNHRVVLGCDDGVIRIFDSRDGSAVGQIDAHGSGIKKVAISPVTGDILSCAYDQKIIVWDAQGFARKIALEGHDAKWERSFGWSPDGATILAGTFDGTVVQWDAITGKLLAEFGGEPGDHGNACFNDAAGAADGSVALVADDGLVRLVRLTDRDARLTACVAPRGGRVLMNAVTRDPTTDRILAGAHDHRLHIFAGPNLETVAQMPLGQGPINSIRVAHCAGHEGAAFAACYSGAIVRISPDGQDVSVHALHDGAVKALRLHPHDPLGVSCSADGGLLSWTLSGEIVHRFAGHTAIVDDVDIAPAGDRIASASRDFTLNIYDIADARLTHSIELGRRSPKSLCFWDDRTVIVGDYWGALVKIDLETGRLVRRTIATNGLSSLSRCGDALIVTSYDGGAYRVSVENLTVENSYHAMIQRIDSGKP